MDFLNVPHQKWSLIYMTLNLTTFKETLQRLHYLPENSSENSSWKFQKTSVTKSKDSCLEFLNLLKRQDHFGLTNINLIELILKMFLIFVQPICKPQKCKQQTILRTPTIQNNHSKPNSVISCHKHLIKLLSTHNNPPSVF